MQQELIDYKEIFKQFPYRSSIKKLDFNKISHGYKLKRDSRNDNKSQMIGSEYFESFGMNEEKSVAVYAYSQRSTTFYDQETIGFRKRKDWLQFKAVYLTRLK